MQQKHLADADNREGQINPVICLDYPDPDVIRVGDTYYMVSTTMHFMPGCPILRSYDLVRWELVSYVYDVLEDTPAHGLEGGRQIYGQGMWAPCIRYHEGTFYICFSANDTKKTYLFRSRSITGPWEKSYIEGFYHDSSLLFDDDGRVYLLFGNKEIRLLELRPDLSGPKEGGLDRIILKDEGNQMLGYEGSHLYKINGRYYAFFIHSRKDCWRRVEACFHADSLEGDFTGGDVLEDDMGYWGQGVAQGGIVDTPEGKWYAVLFQDRGAVGRLPVLVPVRWEGENPVFGENGRVPEKFPVNSTRPGYQYRPLLAEDGFFDGTDEEGQVRLKLSWQWNHRPDPALWSADGKKGTLSITTGKLCRNVVRAVNTLTQRMPFPGCTVQAAVDGFGLKYGDYAGLCAFQGCYGMIALARGRDGYELVMAGRPADDDSLNGMKKDQEPGVEYARIPWDGPSAVLRAETDFRDMQDTAEFFYLKDGRWRPLGIRQKLYFKMDHFCGCRAALFCYATEQTGGTAVFSDFRLRALNRDPSDSRDQL